MPTLTLQKHDHIVELKMKPKSAIVITWDNADPDVYGPFTSQKKAEKRMEEITSKWIDWEWNCQTGHSVRELNK